MANFVQLAQGSFVVDVHGDYHCGPNHESPKTFDYEVEVHYPHTALDDKGFLLDNESFHSYFTGLRGVEVSCERAAKNAACYFWLAANGRCKLVRAALWGIRGAAKVEFILDCHPSEVN